MNTKPLSEKDVEILKILESYDHFIGPTEIGLKLGKTYNQASSYCTLSLKHLLKAGKIVQINGKYKIK